MSRASKHDAWRPHVAWEVVEARAHLYERIRYFFKMRGVQSVETPIWCASTVPDDSIESACVCDASSRILGYLHTSPEFCMKRLVAHYRRSMYQIGHAFRLNEHGRHHREEFSLLEWYRVDWDHQMLMKEVADLLQFLGLKRTVRYASYQEIFLENLGLDPFCEAECTDWIKRHDVHAQFYDRDTQLNYLFSSYIEPHFDPSCILFIDQYPAAQAALACLNPKDPRSAERFEVYVQGIELANGFHELRNAQEQRKRFESHLMKRKKLGLAEYPMDQRFLSAVSQLPPCSGVALGLDRLLMLLLGANSLDDVINFDEISDVRTH